MLDENDKRRKSIRLKGYDYASEGHYFITICIQNRKCLLGKILDNTVKLNQAGKIFETIFNNFSQETNHIHLSNYIIMPNHIHAIIEIQKIKESIPAYNLGIIIGTLKSKTTLEYIKLVKQNKLPAFDKRLWQRNYYEHIIRTENEEKQIREYIQNNPYKWKDDELFIDTV